MLSRHFLRAKALQTIYAGVARQVSSDKDIYSDFNFNVLKLDDLGILQMSTLEWLTFSAERIIESESQKFNPSSNEIANLQRIANNQFIGRLCSIKDYKSNYDRLKIDWSNHFDLFRKVVTSLKQTKQFELYSEIVTPTFDDDKNIAILAFKQLMNDTSLRDVINERELLWEDDFDQIAQYVYMLLKELNTDNMFEDAPCPHVYDSKNEKEYNDYCFARQLALDTFNHMDDVLPMIKKHLQNWDLDRVALMDILLINMAVTEFTCCPSIPERVTVDEYIELSKEFSTEKSKLFINGILDKILIELRVAGKIVKNDRGLYDPDIDGDTPPEN